MQTHIYTRTYTHTHTHTHTTDTSTHAHTHTHIHTHTHTYTHARTHTLSLTHMQTHTHTHTHTQILFKYIVTCSGNIHRETKGLEGGVSSFGDEGRNYGGGGEIYVRNFRFVPQKFGGVILLIESKLTPPNGSYAQDVAGTGVADECRHLLVCFAMRPRLAPAASFA